MKTGSTSTILLSIHLRSMKLNYFPLFLTICFLVCSIGSQARPRKPVTSVRIGNGQPVKLGELPWMGAMVRHFGYMICSAVLIGPQHLLTAGHCSRRYKRPEDFRVVLGEIDSEIGYEKKSAMLEIETLIVHEEFILQEFYKTPDIALIKLKEPVKFRETVGNSSIGGIKPIKLAKENKLKLGDMVEVAGFGHQDENSLLELNRGNKIIRTCPQKSPRGDKIFICTVRDFDRAYVKDGDSGGALYTKHTKCKAPELLGIISTILYDKILVDNKVVMTSIEKYTNVKEFIPWIEEKMKL